jgi:NitT/TauT family transport system substrate-binding protein
MTDLPRSRRRHFLGLAAATMLLRAPEARAASDPPPETRRLRLPRYTYEVACISSVWIAEELLRAEGFDDIQYVSLDPTDEMRAVSAGNVDLDFNDPFLTLLAIDAGRQFSVLSGIHGGCFELFAAAGTRSVRDLKGRRIGYADVGRKAFAAMILAQVGLDPARDVQLVDTAADDGVEMLAKGRLEAYIAFPPEPQQMRARRIGLSLLSMVVDKPWSQYFCCLMVANRSFIRDRPVATKRAMRAILKATELCATDPAGTARQVVARGFLKDEAAAAQALREIPYRRWRDYDSADTLRFYALRMRDVGAVRGNPHKLLAESGDWRFVNELRREMKS